MLQILVRELHNDPILPIPQGGFFGVINEYDKVCGYTSRRKHMTKHIKPTRKRNNITYICKTCISDMLLQSYLNKWW